MTKLPRLTGRELIAALEKAGFSVVRVRGSHHMLRHADGRTTTARLRVDAPGAHGVSR